MCSNMHESQGKKKKLSKRSQTKEGITWKSIYMEGKSRRP